MTKANRLLEGAKEALAMAQGTATGGRYNSFLYDCRLSYDIKSDTLTVINLIAKEIDAEDQRVMNSFKQLTVYEDRYSGDAQKLIIAQFKKDGWHQNKDLLAYALVANLDIEEQKSLYMVETIMNCGMNWN